MQSEKALVIKLNHNVQQSASLFERINHLYVMCEANLDKFILLFAMVKLAVI
jgi:phosphate uptake regulator